MGKRYTDTGLHRKAWFRKLELRFREAWRILCAECDVIGVWEIDMESLNLWVGVPITMPELIDAFDLVPIQDDKLWIRGFVAFQYGDEEGVVSYKNKLTPKIIRMLRARGLPLPKFKDIPDGIQLDPPPKVDPGSPTHGVKVKVIEEDKVKEQEFEIRTLEDLKKKIPLITRDEWTRDYPNPTWLDEQLRRAWQFHTADPAQRPRTAGQWMRKLVTWLDNNWSEQKATGGAPDAAAADAKIKARWGRVDA